MIALGRVRAPIIESRAKRAGRRLAPLAGPMLLARRERASEFGQPTPDGEPDF